MHRDLKPENFLLARTINKTDVKLTDFGLSKIIKPHARSSSWAGTPFYMAPEVIKGNYD